MRLPAVHLPHERAAGLSARTLLRNLPRVYDIARSGFASQNRAAVPAVAFSQLARRFH
jgi:hypothetical protein